MYHRRAELSELGKTRCSRRPTDGRQERIEQERSVSSREQMQKLSIDQCTSQRSAARRSRRTGVA